MLQLVDTLKEWVPLPKRSFMSFVRSKVFPLWYGVSADDEGECAEHKQECRERSGDESGMHCAKLEVGASIRSISFGVLWL